MDKCKEKLRHGCDEDLVAIIMGEYLEACGRQILREFAEAERRGEVTKVPPELAAKLRAIIDAAACPCDGG